VAPRASGALVVLVAVQLSVLGLYLPPVFVTPGRYPPPDDHFTASPHCGVTASGRGRVGGAGGGPTVGARIVPSAGVQSAAIDLCGGAQVISSPDDHFTASPNCRVTRPVTGRIGGGGGRPRIVSAYGTIRNCRKRMVAPTLLFQSLVFRTGAPDPARIFPFAAIFSRAHTNLGPPALRGSAGERSR
jgi:hypothetical protein